MVRMRGNSDVMRAVTVGGWLLVSAGMLAAASIGITRVEAAPATGRKVHRTPRWTTTRLLVSAHATQAVAATERSVYAISNTTVAQHDRTSGKLEALATAPDAVHLNSGFVNEGKVYCAHSNYPGVPPESDIRVFDPATGSLNLFHRFEKPPGSLVWCVHHEGNWWCCFAWYGKQNSQTVVIEYADGGLSRERRRFTFPDAVVADWDGMSASGGVWDGDTLLVSHHHDPVLYRLALPTAGAELELIEQMPCPFPGQGIAADPVTGGLVGIDRAARRIVFAVDERERQH